MKSVVKKDEQGLYVDINAVRQCYGAKAFRKIKSYSFYLSKGGATFVAYDKRGQVIKPRSFPKIGRKANGNKVLKDILG